MEDAQRTRSPGRPPSQQLDRAIHEATIEALSEVGFEALSVADVARRAGTTTPAIYRRFANKRALVLQTLDHEFASVPVGVPDQGSLRADLLAWTRHIVNGLTPARTRLIAGLVFTARTDPSPRERLTATVQKLGASSWLHITQRALTRGELSGAPSQAMLGSVPTALVLHAVLLEDRPVDDTMVEELVDTIMLPALIAAYPASRGDSPVRSRAGGR